MKHWICILSAIMMINTLKAKEKEIYLYNSFRTIEGKEFTLDQFQNKGKTVMIHLWGTWCPPCRKELPDLLQMAQTLHQDLTVIAISSETPEEQTYFLNHLFSEYETPSYNVIFATVTDSMLRERLQFQAVPRSYLFDQNGNFILTVLGRQHWLGMKEWFVPDWWPFGTTWEEFILTLAEKKEINIEP